MANSPNTKAALKQEKLTDLLVNIHTQIRYERATTLFRELIVHKELTIRQIACYYAFLKEYFSRERGELFNFETNHKKLEKLHPRDYAFGSQGNLAKIIRERSTNIKYDNKTFSLSGNQQALLDDITALARKKLIVKQSRSIEEIKYPQLKEIRKKHRLPKTHNKETYQPTDEWIQLKFGKNIDLLWSTDEGYVATYEFDQIICLLEWLLNLEYGDYQLNGQQAGSSNLYEQVYSKEQIRNLCNAGLNEMGIRKEPLLKLLTREKHEKNK